MRRGIHLSSWPCIHTQSGMRFVKLIFIRFLLQFILTVPTHTLFFFIAAIFIMSRTTQPSTGEGRQKAQNRPYVAQRTFYGEWEIPTPNTLPTQPTPEKFHQTYDPDPFINVSFGPRHYPPIAPAGKVALQTPQCPPRTALSKLDTPLQRISIVFVSVFKQGWQRSRH